MNPKDSFCILPFIHLATHPDGKVSPCCESKLYSKNLSSKEHLQVGKHSIKKVRNSDNFNLLRSNMLLGVKDSSCDFCYKREQAGLESKRIRENIKYKTDFNNLEKYSELPLVTVELRLGNICNAKCVICHPGSSSKWNEDITEDITKLNEGYFKHNIVNTWFREDTFYEELLGSVDSIKYLWFNGGEPLLIKEHLKFLKKIIEMNLSSEIELEYHTNGSLINEDIINIWSKFKFVKVTLSLDDIEKRFNYSRFPLEFNSVENGIKLLVDNNIHYDIIPTINLLNVFNISNIYNYFKKKYNKECFFNYLRFPKFQSIVNLDSAFKKQILQESTLSPELHTQLEYELYSEEGTNLSKAFNFYDALDRQRNINIEEYLPEFIKLREYENRRNII